MNIANTPEVCHEIAPSGGSPKYQDCKLLSPAAREAEYIRRKERLSPELSHEEYTAACILIARECGV